VCSKRSQGDGRHIIVPPQGRAQAYPQQKFLQVDTTKHPVHLACAFAGLDRIMHSAQGSAMGFETLTSRT